jgi:hypothetical protein
MLRAPTRLALDDRGCTAAKMVLIILQYRARGVGNE